MYCLHNYKQASENLNKVTSKTCTEAITVLYNYNCEYTTEDLRVTHIKQLVYNSNFDKFSLNIDILRAEGWWEDQVSPDQYESLNDEVDQRL